MKAHRVLLLLGFFLLASSAVSFWPKASQFFAVDSCLDSGGSYNYQESKCDFMQSHKPPVQLAAQSSPSLIGLVLSAAGFLCLLLSLRASRSVRSNQAFNATARKRAAR